MENHQFSSSPQTNISSGDDNNLQSLPPPPSSPLLPPTTSSQCSEKPKKGPNVTPRTFKRFFTPKSSLSRDNKAGASRQVLRDITASASNRPQQRASAKDAVRSSEEIKGAFPEVSKKKRKRHLPISPDTTPDRSSPLKRLKLPSLDISADSEGGRIVSEDELNDSEKEYCKGKPRAINPVQSNLRGRLGWSLSREIGGFSRPRLAQRLYHGGGKLASLALDEGAKPESTDWQCETSNFYTTYKDTHFCDDVGDPEESAVPFCTASCNTNTLIAIGDEEGGIRLLESARNGKPAFSEAYLKFRPHNNAILGLEFSHDDLLLATASGDQTALIIDMPTQTAIYTLAGHSSSVKQTRFQPGSSSVIATSSRDGCVQIWDMRCKGLVPTQCINTSLGSSSDDQPRSSKMRVARPINTIFDAHSVRQPTTAPLSTCVSSLNSRDVPSTNDPPSRRGDVSVTAATFLHQGREHILLTASEANASIKVWDIRTTHSHRRRNLPVPLATTHQPESHTYHRQFGVTSLALSGDGSRLYSMCRDNTVYAYSTSQLILGHAPELSLTSKPRRAAGVKEKEGLGPLYGFRHPQFHPTTFYVKCALRPAVNDKSELLAVGSSDGCAVVFPTDERYLHDPLSRGGRLSDSSSASSFSSFMESSSTDSFSIDSSSAQPPPTLRRTRSGLEARLNDTIPIYQHGSALVGAHTREVTALAWTQESDLISIADDCTARCWRDGIQGEARDLRTKGEGEGRRWGRGWAEVREGFDVEDS